jgi:hypothetical protein
MPSTALSKNTRLWRVIIDEWITKKSPVLLCILYVPISIDILFFRRFLTIHIMILGIFRLILSKEIICKCKHFTILNIFLKNIFSRTKTTR